MSDEISDRRPGRWGFIKNVRALSVKICYDRRACVSGVDVVYRQVVRDVFLAYKTP